MTGRLAEAQAVESLLKGNPSLSGLVDDRIYRGRISSTSAEDGDDIRIYTPRTSGQPDRGQSMPEFDTDITLVIEVRVIGEADWDIRSDEIVTAVMKALFNNAAWLMRFEDVPSYDISQFKDNEGEYVVVGEIITLQLSPVETLSFGPVHDDEPINKVKVEMVGPDDETILEQEITS